MDRHGISTACQLKVGRQASTTRSFQMPPLTPESVSTDMVAASPDGVKRFNYGGTASQMQKQPKAA